MRQTASELRACLGGLADRLHQMSPISEREHRAICGLWREVAEIGARSALPETGEVGFVIGGWACHQRSNAKGRRQILGFLTPGDVHRPTRGANAEAMHAVCLTRVLFVEAGSVFTGPAAAEHPGLAAVLGVCERLAHDHMLSHMVRLASRKARGGLAHLILELEGRTRPPGGAEDDWLDLPIGQRALGHAMGLSTVHVNKTLTRMREDGLIELRLGGVRICDRGRLAALADG